MPAAFLCEFSHDKSGCDLIQILRSEKRTGGVQENADDRHKAILFIRAVSADCFRSLRNGNAARAFSPNHAQRKGIFPLRISSVAR